MRLLRIASVAALLAPAAAASAQASAPVPDERDAVLAVVQRLWAGMRTRDTALVRSVFDSTALLGRVVNREGAARVQMLPVSGFIEALGRATETWDERMFAPEVRIDGPLATVWTEYEFYLGTKFSHDVVLKRLLQEAGL